MPHFILFMFGALMASVGPLHNPYIDNTVVQILHWINIQPNMTGIHLGEGVVSFLGYCQMFDIAWEKAFPGKIIFQRSFILGLIPSVSLVPYFESSFLFFFCGLFLIIGSVSAISEDLQRQRREC